MLPLAAFTIPISVLLAPWLAKSWVLTGNPVYPLLYDWLGGPDWSAVLASEHRAWMRSMGMGRSALDWVLLLPRVLFLGNTGYEHFDGRLHPLLGVLLPPALLGVRRLGSRLVCLGRWRCFLLPLGLRFLLLFPLPLLGLLLLLLL